MTTGIERLSAALADRYRIERELGAGGMATVYLAQDLKHDRKVAIKVLRPELAAVIGAERFLSEIKTTANLQHPHILPLHDSGQADSFLFYVMPFVEGESLRDRLHREKQLPIGDAVRIAKEVSAALHYAHRHGVIHRDIKPENILLHDGQALVADFGIALAVSTAGGARMTETGMSLGTPHYMSPEQAMGDRELTARSDVYALGAMTYEMLLGEPPFTGPTAQSIVAKVMTEKPAPLIARRDRIPPPVEDAVLTALEKLPADRFATAAEFAAALDGAPSARTAARLVTVAAKPGLWRPLAIVAGVLAVAAVAFGVWAWRQHPPRPTVRVSVAFPPGQQVRPTSTLRFSLSRDGARLAYVGPDSAGGTQLWIRDLNSLVGRPLPGTSGAQAPFFSPDGKSVAFFTGSPGNLQVVSVTGGAPRTLVQDSTLPWGGDWADDGTLYFTHTRNRTARVRAGGGAVEVIGQLDSAGFVTEQDWVQALPRGRYLLVQLWRNSVANSEIGLLDVSTGTAKPIIQGFFARYIPSGHVVYATVNGMLHRVPFDPGSGKLTGPPVTIAERVQIDIESGSAQFSLSDNGILAYSLGGREGSGRVVWVDRDGRQSPVDTTWRGQFGGVALSPDDTRLAIAAYGDVGLQIWIKDLPTVRCRASRSGVLPTTARPGPPTAAV